MRLRGIAIRYWMSATLALNWFTRIECVLHTTRSADLSSGCRTGTAIMGSQLRIVSYSRPRVVAGLFVIKIKKDVGPAESRTKKGGPRKSR